MLVRCHCLLRDHAPITMPNETDQQGALSMYTRPTDILTIHRIPLQPPAPRWYRCACRSVVQPRKVRFERMHVHLPERAANGGFAGHARALRLEGGVQGVGMFLCPLRDGCGTALVTQHGSGNHAENKRPRMPFATGVAWVGYVAEGIEQGALLVLVHRGAPYAVWLRARIPYDGL